MDDVRVTAYDADGPSPPYRLIPWPEVLEAPGGHHLMSTRPHGDAITA